MLRHPAPGSGPRLPCHAGPRVWSGAPAVALLIAAAGAPAAAQAGHAWGPRPPAHAAHGDPVAASAADSAAAPCLPADSARGAVRYTVVSAATRPAGCQLVWRTGPRGWRAFYTYNDRGRGPRVAATYALDAAGAPVRVAVAGVDYLKAAVDEHFARDAAAPGGAGRARWASAAEHDSTTLAAGAAPFFVSIDGPPLEGALLADAALRAGARGLPLLPSGRAFAERVRDTVLTAAALPGAAPGAAGERTRVTLVAVRGLGFEPGPIWLDSTGALFAAGSSWSMVIRGGYEGAVPALDGAQRAWSAARERELARRLAERPAGGALVVRHARLFDADAMRTRPNMTVVVRGDRFARVAPDDSVPAAALPPGATVIDAAGRTLLPGLWDMHVHASAGDGLQHLAAGVTSVRDMGNDGSLLDTGRRWARGDALGPRLLMSGFIDGPGPYTGPTGVVAPDEAAALAAVDRYADSGYVQVKVYSSLDTALVAPVARRAHARGLRLSGHVPNGMTVAAFVRAGADEVQHANFLLLNFLGDSAGDTRTPSRFTAVARRGALVDVASDSVRRFVALLRERGTSVDPTLGVFEGMFTARPGAMPAAWAPVADRLPPQVKRYLRAGGGLPVPEGMDARYRASFATMLALVRALSDAGVPVVAGTDGAPGFMLHRELELYEAAGIPAPAVLRLATLGAARVMGRDRDLGSVAEGKLADFVLVDGDPTVHVRDVRRTWLVVKGGTMYRAAALYAAAGVGAP